MTGLFSQKNMIGKRSIERIDKQVKIACLKYSFASCTRAAIYTCEGALSCLYVPVAKVSEDRSRVQTDRNDIIISECAQFVGLAVAILIEIAPDAQVGEHAIK